jgi:Mg2+ and Co2+ transporter CorA
VEDSIKVYIRDVLDHVLRQEEKLKIAKDLLDNMHSNYLAKLSIGLKTNGIFNEKAEF